VVPDAAAWKMVFDVVSVLHQRGTLALYMDDLCVNQDIAMQRPFWRYLQVITLEQYQLCGGTRGGQPCCTFDQRLSLIAAVRPCCLE
jgi:hypothetical protein